jgi:excisionase family DNA binding protein
MNDDLHAQALMTTREVAELFGVSQKTVLRWAELGHLTTAHTPSGRRRFRAAEVHRLRAGAVQARAD